MTRDADPPQVAQAAVQSGARGRRCKTRSGCDGGAVRNRDASIGLGFVALQSAKM